MNKKVERDFMVGNLRCLVIGLSGGWRCGYVGIDKGHPWYCVDYNEIDVNVHGGLTYGGTSPIGDDSQRYYLGFDCTHLGDGFDMKLINDMAEDSRELSVIKFNAELCAAYGNKVWSTTDVENEVLKLASQIMGIEKEPAERELQQTQEPNNSPKL